MSELAAFVLAQIEADEAAARAAIDPERPGTHWQWVNNETDEAFDPERDEEFRVSLRTVEEFPTRSGVGDLPAFPLGYVEADETYALPHIARHDPARVLADCEAKKAIVELHRPSEDAVRDEWAFVMDADGFERRYTPCETCGSDRAPEEYPCPTLRALAQPFAGREGWRDEWAVNTKETHT